MPQFYDTVRLGMFPNEGFKDGWGHNFIDVYLNDTVKMVSGKTLKQQVVEATKSLVNGFQPNMYCTVIGPKSASTTIGQQVQFQAVTQLNGVTLSKQPLFSWSVGGPGAGLVGPGLVKGVAIGSASVRVTDLSMQTSDTATLTVAAVRPEGRTFYTSAASPMGCQGSATASFVLTGPETLTGQFTTPTDNCDYHYLTVDAGPALMPGQYTLTFTTSSTGIDFDIFYGDYIHIELYHLNDRGELVEVYTYTSSRLSDSSQGTQTYTFQVRY